MGMSVAEFLRRKNEIIKAVTGVILVPEDQIVDIPEDKRVLLAQKKKYDLFEHYYLNADYCPYCALYFSDECKDCPMCKAGNCCNKNDHSTWYVANNLWMEKSSGVDWMKLKELIDEYNKQFEITVKEFYEQRRSK